MKTGVQGIYKPLKILDSGACPGPDPGFAGMTEKGIFRLLTRSSNTIDIIFISVKSELILRVAYLARSPHY